MTRGSVAQQTWPAILCRLGGGGAEAQGDEEGGDARGAAMHGSAAGEGRLILPRPGPPRQLTGWDSSGTRVRSKARGLGGILRRNSLSPSPSAPPRPPPPG